jgi:hypothetical protein
MNAIDNNLIYKENNAQAFKDYKKNVSQIEDIQNIHWKQVWSLAALFASIVIGWIAYFNYQPALLQSFGLQKYALP